MSARPAAIADPSRAQVAPGQAIDWVRVTSLVQASRALDDIEETRLLPERKVLYQFSARGQDRKSTRLNSSHLVISYAVFCLKKKKIRIPVSCRVLRAHLRLTG